MTTPEVNLEEVDELWWEGDDMFVRTVDGKVWRYIDARITSITREVKGAGVVAQSCDVVYTRPVVFDE